MVTILSVFILKNPIGYHRILAIVICFVGTLLIIKPYNHNFNWYILLPFFTAFSYSISMILSKITSDKRVILESSLSIILINQFVSI